MDQSATAHRRCSARCSTRRATTSRAAPSASPCSSRAAPTCRARAREAGGVLGGEFAGERPAPAFEPHRIGCVLGGPLAPPSWRDAPRDRPTSSTLKGVARGAARPSGPSSAFEPAAQPFLHPGRAARVRSAAGIGWLGEIHPRRLPRVGPRGRRPAFEIDARGAARRRRPPAPSATRTSPTYPAVQRGHGGRRRRGASAAARSARRCAAAAASCCAASTVFDLYAGEQVPARGERAWRCGSSSAPPDRTLTDEEVAERREAIMAALGELERRSVAERLQPLEGEPAARVLVAGASGFAGALAAAARLAPPAPRARRTPPRAPTPATRLDALYPRYRVPIELTELDLDAGRRTATPPSSPIRTAPPRRVVAELRELGLLVVDLSADFRLRDPQRLRATVRRARPRRSCSARPSTGSPSCTASRSARRSWSPTPAATRPRPCSRSPRSPSAGLIADVVVNATSGVSGRRAGRGRPPHFVTVDENVSPYGVDGPPPRARDRPGAGGARRRGAAAHLRSAPAAARPGRAGLAATCGLTRDVGADELRVALRGALRGRAVRRAGRRARPGFATSATRTSAGSTSPSTRGRARARLRGDRQPLEGGGRAGDPEPEPDARAGRDGGALQ